MGAEVDKMKTSATIAPVEIKRLLCLTDFSPVSEKALRLALELAGNGQASVEVLHVLTPVIPESCPEAIHADEALAQGEMKKLESTVTGVAFKTIMARGMGLWEAVERTIHDDHIDAIVLSTHGRTGVSKMLLGSVAEEVFRRSPIPVLTVGPSAPPAGDRTRFQRILFATDFSPESEAAVPYLFSLAQENHSMLFLLHVMPQLEARTSEEVRWFELSVADVIDRLRRMIPGGAETYNPPEVVVEHGDPADRIVAAANGFQADLIVLGVRGAAGHLGAATHLERAIAHRVVIRASCPVLTVRAHDAAASA
jgi:nucleotide-binding universal stress UspA family protein